MVKLRPEDIADAVLYMVTRDRRVAVNEMLVRFCRADLVSEQVGHRRPLGPVIPRRSRRTPATATSHSSPRHFRLRSRRSTRCEEVSGGSTGRKMLLDVE